MRKIINKYCIFLFFLGQFRLENFVESFNSAKLSEHIRLRESCVQDAQLSGLGVVITKRGSLRVEDSQTRLQSLLVIVRSLNQRLTSDLREREKKLEKVGMKRICKNKIKTIRVTMTI